MHNQEKPNSSHAAECLTKIPSSSSAKNYQQSVKFIIFIESVNQSPKLTKQEDEVKSCPKRQKSTRF